VDLKNVTVALPTGDLRRAFLFYRDGIGLALAAAPEEGSDMPEPVRFVLHDRTSLMLIPKGGFSWVSQGNSVAERGVSECIVNVGVQSREEVDELVKKAGDAGGEVSGLPKEEVWGYSGAFKDLDGHVWMVAVAG
jgi:uncharacterized protein